MYCVYLTTYSGKNLPPFYIGSSSVKRVEDGYRGSVTSKEYSEKWKTALREEPELFTTEILHVFDTRTKAFEKECQLQEEVDAVKSPLYINKSYARKNGYFGGEQFGENNPMWGKTTTPEAKQKISAKLTNRRKSKETRARMSAARALVEFCDQALENLKIAGEKRRGENHVFFGKKRPKEVGSKISASKEGKFWWTDGVLNKFCQHQPAPTWRRGITRPPRVAKKMK